ncbi:MAG: cyclic nucleotide-binding domain-containing protein [Lentisphaerales bacterium]|nr:cyclic nucleotide-binding domain-containing protein [Lentisphaerales bacterium]
MANKEKTTISLLSDFPHDMATYKPFHKGIEVFDRASENPAHRFSLKSSDENYCVISEDEKYVFELMDGQKTIDELAAEFMEAKGKIALSMIRSLTFRLWQNGILIDSERKITTDESDTEGSKLQFKIPGISSLAAFLYPFPGILFINPVSYFILIAFGLYGTNVISQSSENLQSAPPLFVYNNNTTLGLGILALSILAAAIVRFTCLCMAHRKHRIKIKTAGILSEYGFWGLYLEAPGVTILKAGQRFWLRLSGMIAVFGISGVLLTLSTLKSFSPEASLLFYQIAFYQILYLLYHCCPLINSDLYLACADYLDELYLRRSSMNFIQSHIKSFFAPERSEKGDNIIYIMFCAGALLWLAGTAQLLLTAISQNSAILSGLFNENQATSTLILLGALILPIISGIIISSYLMYKFFINSVTSLSLFQASRNMVALMFSIAVCLLFLIRVTDESTRYILYIILAIASALIVITKSLQLAKAQAKSHAKMQSLAIVLFTVSIGSFIILKCFAYQASGLFIVIALLSLSLSLLLYSLSSIKVDWAEYIKSRIDSGIITVLLILGVAGFWYLHSQFSLNISNSVTVPESNSTISLYCFIILSISAILTIPAIIYKRKTEIFTPTFSIVFALHLLFYFSILVFAGHAKLHVWESIAAASMLLLIGTEAYHFVYYRETKDLPIFPLQDGENEKLSLVTGFQYIIDSTLNAVSTDFGASRSSYIKSNFKQYAQKMQWNWDLTNIPKDDDNINTLGEIYKNSFHKVHQLTNECCGESYTTNLLQEIDDHLHSQARVVIKSRVGELSQYAINHTVTTMSDDKKKQLIANTIFFDDIQGPQLSQLKDCLHTSSYEEGELIIKQHDQGDRLYIISEGKVQVEIENMAGQSQVVSYIMANEFFGEIALLTASPRTASVRACEQTTVLYIKKKDFDAFLGFNPEKKENIIATLNYLRLIKSIPLFRELDSSLINLLAGKMQKEIYKQDDKIIKQGDEGDKFYIILEGDCDVHVDRDDKKNHKVTTLSKGEYFGEIALIRDIPRTATITTASTEALVLSLQKKDFVDVISSHELLASNFNDASHRRIIEMMH